MQQPAQPAPPHKTEPPPPAADSRTSPAPTPAPLDRESQLVALLAAKGVITTKEASDLTGHSEEKLTAEVEAWAVVAEPKR